MSATHQWHSRNRYKMVNSKVAIAMCMEGSTSDCAAKYRQKQFSATSKTSAGASPKVTLAAAAAVAASYMVDKALRVSRMHHVNLQLYLSTDPKHVQLTAVQCRMLEVHV